MVNDADELVSSSLKSLNSTTDYFAEMKIDGRSFAISEDSN